MIKTTLIVPTNGNLEKLNNLANSIINNTAVPDHVTILIVDNKNTNNIDLYPFTKTFNNKFKGDVFLLNLSERVGLTSAWNIGLKHSATDWTFFLNDDSAVTYNWDIDFHNLTIKNPKHEIFLLCQPYNWSGWAANREFFNKFPFNTAFPEGYWEDDDIYFRVAKHYNLKVKNEIYSKDGPIYCMPYIDQKFLITHHPINEPGAKKWNEKANKAIFNIHWQKVEPNHPEAIQSKNEIDYYAPRES